MKQSAKILKENMLPTEAEGIREIRVKAYPYASTEGTIQVPSNLTNQKEIEEYVTLHFDDIVFGEPQLDYKGTDFDIYTE